MLKMIGEKEKVSFVYTKTGIPMLVSLLSLLVFGFWVSLLEVISVRAVAPLVLIPLAGFGITFLLLKRKQVLVIDGNHQVIEEYIRNSINTFLFSAIEFADVERFRETINPVPSEVHEGQQASSIPHLNYHPFLKLNTEAQKHFIFDGNGKGMDDYKEAKRIIESINSFIGLKKEQKQQLNVYKLRPSSVKKFGKALIIGIVLLALIYAGLRWRGLM